jgi:secreted PhoX family phosphatase
MNRFTLFFTLFYTASFSQTIGNFKSVTPTVQTQQLILPSTHTFQKLIQTGDPLSNGGGYLKDAPDFTAYVPINGSSTKGYISLNHELNPGGVSILDVEFNNTNTTWSMTNAQLVDLSAVGGLTAKNCSGGITPWGTVLSGEETSELGDSNNDGYDDYGWLMEVNPVTRKAVRKLWAVGRADHENAALTSDGKIIYTGSDHAITGFLYKFVCTTANNPTEGTLYALKLTTGGNGEWLRIPNTTKAEQNNTNTLATAAGATNIRGIEDVEIGPDGKIYLAAKYSQEVYRFNDNGTRISNYETYVSARCYTFNDVCEPYSYPNDTGNDNLAFDGEGNLWVLQDGGRNHIWVVGPTHTAGGTNDVRLFATTPAESEPTGITFSPDFKFMFISIMHPSTANSARQIDAAGNSVVFNKGTTLVIGRKEFLGKINLVGSSPPLIISDFTARVSSRSQVRLYFTLHNATNTQKIVLERSINGVNYERLEDILPLNPTSTYSGSFTDRNPYGQGFYRLKITDNSEKDTFSNVISTTVKGRNFTSKVAPNPFTNTTRLSIEKNVHSEETVISIYNLLGNLIFTKKLESTDAEISLGDSLPMGMYILKIDQQDLPSERIWLMKSQ